MKMLLVLFLSFFSSFSMSKNDQITVCQGNATLQIMVVNRAYYVKVNGFEQGVYEILEKTEIPMHALAKEVKKLGLNLDLESATKYRVSIKRDVFYSIIGTLKSGEMALIQIVHGKAEILGIASQCE